MRGGPPRKDDAPTRKGTTIRLAATETLSSPESPAPQEGTRGQRRAHARARRSRKRWPLYALVRVLLTPPLRLWFRVRFSGVQNIPDRGPAIIAANHKNFLDPFFLGLATRRHVRFMAKAELFRPPLGRVLVRLGAFPVRRGEADADSVTTARAILDDGGLVVMFLEGTRVDMPDALGSPHHGAARLALATGAPILPAAVAGTSKLFLGPFPKPRTVRVSFLPLVSPAGLAPVDDPAFELIDHVVWPAVQEEYGRLAATPGVIAAGLATAGIGAGLLARHQHRPAARPRVLGIVEPPSLRRRRRRAARSRRRRELRHRLHLPKLNFRRFRPR